MNALNEGRARSSPGVRIGQICARSRNKELLSQLCGVVITIGSLWLIYGFVLSEAWFGVMIALFVAAAGLKAAIEPDIVRFGAPENERTRLGSGPQDSDT